MSYWTHIVASIDVDTNEESNNIKEIVEEILQNAPKITGSEGNAEVFVNVLSNYNVWVGSDCRKCPYKYSKRITNNIIECITPEDFECPEGEYQTRVVITVIGDLRDRVKEQTKEEYKEFKNYLKKCNFFIRNASASIVD